MRRISVDESAPLLTTTPMPAALISEAWAVAITRDAGSGGGSVAEITARKLGRRVVTQEMIDFLTYHETSREEFFAETPASVLRRADMESRLHRGANALDPSMYQMIRIMNVFAFLGDSVIVGRGAGFVLPAARTVHVHVTAPHAVRIAAMCQKFRLTEREAREETERRNRRRSEILSHMTDTDVDDPASYDLVINTARVSVDVASDLIVTLLNGRRATDDPPSTLF